MSVQSLHYMSEYDQAIASQSLSVIDWWAQWCSPCLQIAPKIEQLTKSYPTVKFYKIDVDAASDIATRAGISAMPTFHFYKNGKLLDTVVGARLSAIKDKLERYA